MSDDNWLQNILSYNNSSAKRNLTVVGDLESDIRNGVASVYGPGYRAEIISGGQGKDSNGMTGSRRHTTSTAGDVYIYNPQGKRLEGDDLIPMAQHWQTQKLGGVGFPAKSGQSMHLDLVGGSGKGSIPREKGEGMLWYYGTPSKTQAAALTSGQAPKYAIPYDDVRSGLATAQSGPSVATLLDVGRLVEAPNPRSRSAGAAARTNATLGPTTPVKTNETGKLPMLVVATKASSQALQEKTAPTPNRRPADPNAPKEPAMPTMDKILGGLLEDGIATLFGTSEEVNKRPMLKAAARKDVVGSLSDGYQKKEGDAVGNFLEDSMRSIFGQPERGSTKSQTSWENKSHYEIAHANTDSSKGGEYKGNQKYNGDTASWDKVYE